MGWMSADAIYNNADQRRRLGGSWTEKDSNLGAGRGAGGQAESYSSALSSLASAGSALGGFSFDPGPAPPADPNASGQAFFEAQMAQALREKQRQLAEGQAQIGQKKADEEIDYNLMKPRLQRRTQRDIYLGAANLAGRGIGGQSGVFRSEQHRRGIEAQEQMGDFELAHTRARRDFDQQLAALGRDVTATSQEELLSGARRKSLGLIEGLY